MNNIENINMLYKYALDNSEYILLKEMFYSALFFNTAASMALKNIRIVRKTNNKDKIIIPNYFAITFAGSGCVDEETEFLTPKGWKKISEYEFGDLVCQWNEDGSTQFVNPIAYISEPEYRECYYIDGGKNSNTNRFLCPDHRVPYLTEEKKYKDSVYKSKLKVAKYSSTAVMLSMLLFSATSTSNCACFLNVLKFSETISFNSAINSSFIAFILGV